MKKEERRTNPRKEVLDSFHMFIVIPKFGLHKIYLYDIAENGLSFLSDEKFKENASLDVFFHINPNLRLPLSLNVLHVQKHNDKENKIGCELNTTGTSKPAFEAYLSFLKLLDQLPLFLSPTM